MKNYDRMIEAGFRDRSATHINAIMISCRSKGFGLKEIHAYLRHVGKGLNAISFFTKGVNRG